MPPPGAAPLASTQKWDTLARNVAASPKAAQYTALFQALSGGNAAALLPALQSLANANGTPMDQHEIADLTWAINKKPGAVLAVMQVLDVELSAGRPVTVQYHYTGGVADAVVVVTQQGTHYSIPVK